MLSVINTHTHTHTHNGRHKNSAVVMNRFTPQLWKQYCGACIKSKLIKMDTSDMCNFLYIECTSIKLREEKKYLLFLLRMNYLFPTWKSRKWVMIHNGEGKVLRALFSCQQCPVSHSKLLCLPDPQWMSHQTKTWLYPPKSPKRMWRIRTFIHRPWGDVLCCAIWD